MITRDAGFYRRFFSLTGVIALQNVLVFSVNLADNIMLGKYSEPAMSGASLCNQIQFLLMMLVVGTANGISVICSQYWGKGKVLPIKRVFAVGMATGLAMALLLGAVVLAFPQGVLRLLTDETEIIAEGAEYLKIMGFSYCIFAATNIILGVLRSVETVKIGFAVSAVSLFVNITLNYGLIYGRLGMPEMGIRGAAFATLAARTAELLIVCVYLFCIDKKLRVRPLDLLKIEKDYFRDYIRTGFPLVASSGSWGIAMGVQTAILGRLGASAISANSIATTLFQVVSVLHQSSANAAGVIIGTTVGKGDIPRVKEYSKTLQLLFVAVGIVAGSIIFFAKAPIISLYNVTADSARLSDVFLTVLSVTVVGTAYQMPALTGIVSGGGSTRFVLFNDMIFMWGIVLPLSALSAFVFRFPVWVTFSLLKCDQILKCAVAAVKVNRFRWIKDVTR